MDRAIFELNAGVEATSLYILICALMDQGESPTLNRAVFQWHGTKETLREAAEELISRGVLARPASMSEDLPLQVNPSTMWH